MTKRRATKTDPSSKRSKVVPDLPPSSPSPEEQAQVSGGAVSRYLGETEKNLARLLSPAPSSDTSLLFTEGDQLLK